MEKFILGYEGIYKISDIGVVTSCGRNVRNGSGSRRYIPESVISQSENGSGYKVVHLYMNNKRKVFYVHRLVASLFLDSNGMSEVNHIDGDKGNNNKENLEWCSRSENVSHAYSSGLRGSASNSPLFKGPIIAESPSIGYVMFGKSHIKSFGFDSQSVYRCVNKKQKTHKGFRFHRN